MPATITSEPAIQNGHHQDDHRTLMRNPQKELEPVPDKESGQPSRAFFNQASHASSLIDRPQAGAMTGFQEPAAPMQPASTSNIQMQPEENDSEDLIEGKSDNAAFLSMAPNDGGEVEEETSTPQILAQAAPAGTTGAGAATKQNPKSSPTASTPVSTPASPKAPKITPRSSFGESGYNQNLVPIGDDRLINPFSSEIEDELSRLSKLAENALYGQKNQIATAPVNLDADIKKFVGKYLLKSTKEQKAILVELMQAYMKGYVGTVPQKKDVKDYVERQQGGYDAMARLIAKHTGKRTHAGKKRKKKDQWALSKSKELMQVLHDMGYWQDLDRRIVEKAVSEYAKWTDTADPQRKQRSESHLKEATKNKKLLEAYWNAAGRKGAKGLAKASAEDRATPWSAAFISYIMQEAGAGDTFKYSSAHSVYGAEAKKNKTKNKSKVTHPSRLLDAAKEPVQLGDLIHRRRSESKKGLTYKTLRSGDSSHADFVVAIEIYDAKGKKVQGHYKDIIAQTPAAILKTYQVFAATIGGNTMDEELKANKQGALAIKVRDRSGKVAHRDNETAGRRHYKLNSDLTIDHKATKLHVYGIQRMVHPPRSVPKPI